MYKELQEKVFRWLKKKYEDDNTFTFSVRQKANKGAELNYFIGTEKSMYFSTTFWFVPVAYPGSSSDLINLVFSLTNENRIEFHFQWNQTKNPNTEQNKYALQLIRNVKPEIEKIFPFLRTTTDDNKMEFFAVHSNSSYFSFEELKDELEQFISKIIPVVDNSINILRQAHPEFIAHRFSSSNQIGMFDKMNRRFEKYKFNDGSENESSINLQETHIADKEINMKHPLNQILYGPPGTGKTYHTINKALAIVAPDFDLSQEREVVKDEFDKYLENGQIVFTTFHQSMTYEDFVEGIKPLEPKATDSYLSYDVQSGLFKQICAVAESNLESAGKDNIGKPIFEEAFEQLKLDWEDDKEMKFSLKREGYEYEIIGFTNTSIQFKKASGGTGHTMSIKTLKDLYYGRRTFDLSSGIGIYYPSILSKLSTFNSNLSLGSEGIQAKRFVIIIDEINRGNVSAIFGELITLIEESKRLGNEEALEVTLPYSKKKFGVPNNLHIIGTMNTADRSVDALDTALRRRFTFEEMMPNYDVIKSEDSSGLDLSKILKTINDRIEVLLDRDHLIGHSYFLHVDSIDSLETLQSRFKDNIIPLLQEYFYGDYGKIGLVLGEGFVTKKEGDKVVFASFDYESDMYSEKSIYTLKSTWGEGEFREAIGKLLRNYNQ